MAEFRHYILARFNAGLYGPEVELKVSREEWMDHRIRLFTSLTLPAVATIQGARRTKHSQQAKPYGSDESHRSCSSHALSHQPARMISVCLRNRLSSVCVWSMR